MPFSDTSNYTGLIQHFERLTLLGNGQVSGNSTLLKEVTAEINLAYDEVLPIVFSSDRKWQWDDKNHSAHPIATTDIVSGQADYAFTSDENGNSILSLDRAYFLDGSSQTEYRILRPADHHSNEAREVFMDNPSNTGVPRQYDKYGASIWLDPEPNYNATKGLKVLFRRTPEYYESTDTSKTPGIPRPYHQLLSLIAARNWVEVHKSNNSNLITSLNNRIERFKVDLEKHMNRRSRDEKLMMRTRSISAE